ncbi:sulfurtransferase/chromate resistance protein [Cognatishimia sp. WU-CL00825]|uniref:sulfurtransferase/chromate resistance protein n=1 Tax=Cognatishimia sp. WU-CL00825 TaxID=3127658 RepID=UPI0031054D09
MPGLNEISPAHLMRLIGTPDCPVLIDVRLREDIADAPRFVPTSVCLPHTDLPRIHNHITQQNRSDRAVIICQKGKKLSFGVASWLRNLGVTAEVLSGGQFAWEAENLPQVPQSILQSTTSLWVTRHRPKIDRIACPWLIRRFVDPTAQFLFVPPAEVEAVAEKFAATAFDMPDGEWSHRGDLCTFDTMISRFGLAHTALDRLAQVVRAADTNRHDLSPQAAGLLAISTGLSRQYKDDTSQLQAGLPIYDALYRWARDAFAEGHDWPQSTGEK